MNCNDTLTYAKELRRMCSSYHICKGCPLQHDSHCLYIPAINKERISILQRWSESHPDSLKKERLIQNFKDYWGSDLAEEDISLYNALLEWLQKEVEKI